MPTNVCLWLQADILRGAPESLLYPRKRTSESLISHERAKGYLPWKLEPFLDYAADELNFLQKVGGGYLFIHRYLLEHFAAMQTPDAPPPPASETPPEAETLQPASA